MSIMYMNLNVSQGHELRSTFRLHGPGWNWSADPGGDWELASETQQGLLGGPSPSPFIRSLLRGIIGPNHF